MADATPDLLLPSQSHSTATAPRQELISRPAAVGVWVGLSGYLYTKTVYPGKVTHLGTNRARRRATLSTCTNDAATTPKRHSARSARLCKLFGGRRCRLFIAFSVGQSVVRCVYGCRRRTSVHCVLTPANQLVTHRNAIKLQLRLLWPPDRAGHYILLLSFLLLLLSSSSSLFLAYSQGSQIGCLPYYHT